MKYINPEMKINMFEIESVVTVASANPENEIVSGLDGIKDVRQVKMSELLEVTKFTF